jgi:uncharacterized OB-fold protein
MTEMQKPLPTPTHVSQPFWDGLRQHKVLLQYSPSTGQWLFYPRSRAPGSLANDLEYREVSGQGHVHTFTIARRPTAPAWEDAVPQLLAVVELDEGPRLTTELVNIAPEDIKVGMRVKPVFEPQGESGITLLKYGPA